MQNNFPSGVLHIFKSSDLSSISVKLKISFKFLSRFNNRNIESLPIINTNFSHSIKNFKYLLDLNSKFEIISPDSLLIETN